MTNYVVLAGDSLHSVQIRSIESGNVWIVVSEHSGQDCVAFGWFVSGSAPDRGVVRSGTADYEGIFEECEGYAGDGR